MDLYFDNAAAVPTDAASLDRFRELSLHYFANQEASGAHAEAARTALKQAAIPLKNALGAPADSVLLWTSTGTEAIRAAIRLIRSTFPGGGRVLTSPADHAAVAAAIDELLPDSQFHVVSVHLRPDGDLDPMDFSAKLTSDTVLATVTFVQSETGAITDPAPFRRLLRNAAPHAKLFVDAVQGIGKIPFDWRSAAPDLLVFSGQKLGAPGGGGVILPASMTFAASQMRFRDHAVNRVPPAIPLLLSEIIIRRLAELDTNRALMRNRKKELAAELERLLPGKYRFTLPQDDSAAVSEYIAHLLIPGCQGAVLTRALALNEVSVAPGSACNAEDPEPSKVLRAMGISRDAAYTALRISMRPEQTAADVKELCLRLAKTLAEY